MSANNSYKKQILQTISLAAIALIPLTTIALPAAAESRSQRTLSTQNRCRANQFESEVINLINQERQRAGLRSLRINCELVAAAQYHSLDMVRTGRLSHRSSDGSSILDRATNFGYRPRAIAENVASGQRSPEEVVNAWMNSRGHRRNILNPRYSETGVGYVNGYWTQVFGSAR